MKYKKIIKKIFKAIREGTFLEKVYHEFYIWWMKKFSFVMRHYWDKRIPVEQDRILFLTFQKNYTCNPKYICEEIIKRKLPWKLVWVKGAFSYGKFPPEVETVPVYSLKYFHALYNSGIWIDNAFNVAKAAIIKRPNQFYLETWHGSLGIKRINAETVNEKEHRKQGAASRKLIDACISNSTFETDVYRSSFWPDNTIWMMGHARNDILFETRKEVIDIIRQKVYRELQIPPHVRLILYAPTFRSYDLKEKLDAEKLISYLENVTGSEWRLLERAHRRDKEEYVIHKEKVVNAFSYEDIQELMLVADIGITDYSSWIFDYMLTRKPGFIFAPDLERYIDSRGFYYPIETTPFPIARDTDELIGNLYSFDEQIYRNKVEAFLREKGCVDDGHAAERIVDQLEQLISEKPKGDLYQNVSTAPLS